MSDHDFCRTQLAHIMKEVRAVFTKEQIKEAWAWGYGGTKGSASYEFHGPNGTYFTCSRADCRWSAASEGWSKLLAPKEAE